ncbi:MAG: hypothetical protein ACJ8M4_07845 [Chthoniobacterales bacterium]
MSLVPAFRTIAIFAAASLAAVGAGAATLSISGVPVGSWLRNPIGWVIGVFLATGLMLLRSSLPVARVILAAAVLGVAGTFLAPAQSGVHRWIDLGPLHINMAALLLPAAVVALAFCGIASRIGLTFTAAMATLLVLQPDASQSTSFLVAVINLVALSTPSRGRVPIAIAAAIALAISWTRPDPLKPVAEVEGIFRLAFSVSPLLAAAAGLALAAASLAPLSLRRTAGPSHRNAAVALTGYFISAAICPAFGAFPVPLVGLGMSFPLGYWLGIALLCAHDSSMQKNANQPAVRSSPAGD